jgi:hypothetical protein
MSWRSCVFLSSDLTKLGSKWFATVLRPGSNNWRRPGRGQRIKRSAGLIILLISITAPRPPVSNQFRPNTASSKIQNISFATLLFLLLSIGRNKNNSLLLIMLIAERCFAREFKLSRCGRREKDPAAAEKKLYPFSERIFPLSRTQRATWAARLRCADRHAYRDRFPSIGAAHDLARSPPTPTPWKKASLRSHSYYFYNRNRNPGVSIIVLGPTPSTAHSRLTKVFKFK